MYREFQSKTRQEGYQTGARIQLGCLIVSAQGLGLDAWLNCLGNIYFLVLGGHWPRCYVQTDPKWEPGADYWYTNRLVGKNTLGDTLKI